MGAFDGLNVPYDHTTEGSCKPNHTYIPGQPAFYFTESFTLSDLIREFRHAESVCADCVYVPSPYKGYSPIRLDLWYAEALIEHLRSLAKLGADKTGEQHGN